MSLFKLKSPDLDFSKESTHGILKHRYAEFILWEWDLDGLSHKEGTLLSFRYQKL